MTSVNDLFSFSNMPALPEGKGAMVGDVPGIASLSSAEKFDQAVRLAEIERVDGSRGATDAGVTLSLNDGVSPIARSDDPSSVVRTYGQMHADAVARENERAVQGVSIGEPVNAASAEKSNGDDRGQIILDGLSGLRKAFDLQASNVHESTLGPSISSEKLLQTQVEIVKYTLLMDVTSKLVGKSTQTLDTLLKGQ